MKKVRQNILYIFQFVGIYYFAFVSDMLSSIAEIARRVIFSLVLKCVQARHVGDIQKVSIFYARSAQIFIALWTLTESNAWNA